MSNSMLKMNFNRYGLLTRLAGAAATRFKTNGLVFLGNLSAKSARITTHRGSKKRMQKKYHWYTSGLLDMKKRCHGVLQLLKIMKSIEILKWASTACIIAAAVGRAFEFHGMDMAFSIIGTGGWAFVAYKMQEKALVTVNAAILGILLVGLAIR